MKARAPAILLSTFPNPSEKMISAVKSAATKGRGIRLVGIIPKKTVELIDDGIAEGRTIIQLPEKFRGCP